MLYYFYDSKLKAMSLFEEFPSIHHRIYPCGNSFCSLYEIGRSLSGKDLRDIITQVNAKGYQIERLEFYEYAPMDTMRHLFVKMRNETESVPYFMLDKTCWKEIVSAILVKAAIFY